LVLSIKKYFFFEGETKTADHVEAVGASGLVGNSRGPPSSFLTPID
jgi:hypothetical protein